ncbi:glycosyl hydrolase [Paenibacillus kobensis]|uniref:glycosyl hydrolase n=1 Tax=Paenibacillus kobensis TaxID=59841 RepID=UPI0013E3E7AC|nr:glycosyl hydrolase [Paenibacillus kobensis]
MRADTVAQDRVYDFEDGTDMGWWPGWGDALGAVQVSDDLSVTGNQYALRIDTSYNNDAEWQNAAIHAMHGLDLAKYANYEYDLYVPASFPGTLSVSTALNSPWNELNYSNHNIPSLASSAETINGRSYVTIHKKVSLPSSAPQSELVIQLQKNGDLVYNGPIYLDNVKLTPRTDMPTQPPGNSNIIGPIPAKEAVLAGSGPVFQTGPVWGDELYAGDGYVSFFYEADDANPGTATWSVNTPDQGLYTLYVGYYAPYGYKETTLIVNGQTSGNAALPVPADGAVVSEQSLGKVLLNAGANTIGFGRNWGYYGIEYIKLVSDKPVPDRVEAETGVLEGGVTAGSDGTGYSGTGYAFMQGSGSITLTYNAKSAGLYDFAIGYRAPFGYKETNVLLNGQPSSSVQLPETTDFTEKSAGKLLLVEGENTIRFEPFWGWYHLDYIALTPSAPPKEHKVAKTLVNPNASPEAKALHNYLVDQYGKHIIAGQQSLSNAEWINEQTGKYPALVSFDMIEYSPSRVEHGSTSHEVEDMIEWAERGGIISLCWHWNSPIGYYDEPGKEWWRGFYTEFTTFDLEYALSHPESQEYQLLLRDIDAISAQLQRLEDLGIPVIWRPLHEAEGGWFWWGAKGPEAAKQLWRLMYDRMTNVNGLDNLIWLWNSASPEWYPGDDVVDIISADIYNAAGDYSPNSNKYEQLVNLVGDRKLVTLPENGPIPDPDLLQIYKADWSWFSTWNDYFIRDGVTNTAEHLDKVFNSDYVLTLDELPNNLLTYGMPVTSALLSDTAVVNGWYKGDVTVTLNASAQTEGDVVTKYTINGGEPVVYTEPFTVSGEGVTAVSYYSTDAAGNRESAHTLSIAIDRVAPVVKLLQNGHETAGVTPGDSLSFQLESTDAGSGLASEQLLLDGQPIAENEQVNTSQLSAGVHTIVYTVTDQAGNAASGSAAFEVAPILATGKPGKPVLSHNNGFDTGLRDGSYTVTMNMYYGSNGTTYKSYENGVLIGERRLADASPSAQSSVIDVSGKPNGTYTYTCELTNVFGTTACDPMDVVVDAANPGSADLSHDNWDGDGTYNVKMNLYFGTNATKYVLYENGQPIDTQTLTAATPGAQQAVTSISGRAAGTYTYYCELVNDSGSTASQSIAVVVNK